VYQGTLCRVAGHPSPREAVPHRAIRRRPGPGGWRGSYADSGRSAGIRAFLFRVEEARIRRCVSSQRRRSEGGSPRQPIKMLSRAIRMSAELGLVISPWRECYSRFKVNRPEGGVTVFPSPALRTSKEA
jgi:hypothetical protein